MKKLIIMSILLFTNSAFGQINDVIPDSVRTKILRATDEALNKWAPGYNRKYKTPTIEHFDASNFELRFDDAISTYQFWIEDGSNPQAIDSYKWVGKLIVGTAHTHFPLLTAAPIANPSRKAGPSSIDQTSTAPGLVIDYKGGIIVNKRKPDLNDPTEIYTHGPNRLPIQN